MVKLVVLCGVDYIWCSCVCYGDSHIEGICNYGVTVLLILVLILRTHRIVTQALSPVLAHVKVRLLCADMSQL